MPLWPRTLAIGIFSVPRKTGLPHTGWYRPFDDSPHEINGSGPRPTPVGRLPFAIHVWTRSRKDRFRKSISRSAPVHPRTDTLGPALRFSFSTFPGRGQGIFPDAGRDLFQRIASVRARFHRLHPRTRRRAFVMHQLHGPRALPAFSGSAKISDADGRDDRTLSSYCRRCRACSCRSWRRPTLLLRGQRFQLAMGKARDPTACFPQSSEFRDCIVNPPLTAQTRDLLDQMPRVKHHRHCRFTTQLPPAHDPAGQDRQLKTGVNYPALWPALSPPEKRAITSARSDSQSTILPFALSSPHCAPDYHHVCH